MDTWGFALIIVSVICYYLTRKRAPSVASFFLVTFGVGLGIVIGAVWALAIIDSTFTGLY